MFGPVKREAGERPARSRRCERGVMLRAAMGRGRRMPLGKAVFAGNGSGFKAGLARKSAEPSPGKVKQALTLKSEDLPAVCAM